MSNQFQICRKTRDAVILNLRRIFTGDPKYPYVETTTGEYDWDQTKIVISDIIPQEHAFFPIIVVDTVSGEETRYLGPDSLKQNKNVSNRVISDELFSSLELTVHINVYTIDDTIARDEIVDRIYDHLKLITDDLADHAIEVRRVSFLPDSRTFIGDRWYLTARISLDVYTEWTDDLGSGLVVEKLPIQIILNP